MATWLNTEEDSLRKEAVFFYLDIEIDRTQMPQIWAGLR